MKKLGLIMMPLVAVSLLASCGSSKTDPKKIYSQKELMNALKFAGVEYLQDKTWTGKSDYFTIHEFSPTTYHIKQQIDLAEDSYYHYEGQTLWKYYYDENKSGFVKQLDEAHDDFIKIEQIYDGYGFAALVSLGLNYESLNYNDGVYTYSSSEIYGETLHVLLEFNAKKITSVEMYEIEDGKEEREYRYEFTYEEKEIPLPTPIE